ncbi:Pantothenate transporter liz1 [Colletotrichum sp. SAR11_59]|nr:Pantothenate transporter liz1 [Colletotrichum sp. SAR11_59]
MADKSSVTQDQDSSHTKRDGIVHNVVGDVEVEAAGERKRGWFHRSGRSEERKLLLKLDFFILSRACFGYFLRLLDASNLRNAYVSGMEEVTWAILTFCFAAVKNFKHIYALRLLLGLAESPFYVGGMTLLGSWYTPKATRATISYSASFTAQMFSGYLQAAVYTGLDGVHGIPGWRWLFIMCGIINVPGAVWGFFAVPDSPYDTRVFYLNEEERELAKSRVVEVGRKRFEGVTLKTFRSVLSRSFVWVFILNYIFFCIDTYGLDFFAIYLKTLNEYTVQEINV